VERGVEEIMSDKDKLLRLYQDLGGNIRQKAKKTKRVARWDQNIVREYFWKKG
jgi:hypothetical protein